MADSETVDSLQFSFKIVKDKDSPLVPCATPDCERPSTGYLFVYEGERPAMVAYCDWCRKEAKAAQESAQ